MRGGLCVDSMRPPLRTGHQLDAPYMRIETQRIGDSQCSRGVGTKGRGRVFHVSREAESLDRDGGILVANTSNGASPRYSNFKPTGLVGAAGRSESESERRVGSHGFEEAGGQIFKGETRETAIRPWRSSSTLATHHIRFDFEGRGKMAWISDPEDEDSTPQASSSKVKIPNGTSNQ